MHSNTEVPWRFGERYLVTDFIMSKNVAIMEQANKLTGDNTDSFVEAVSKWIGDGFMYPFDNAGNPSASGQLLRHQKGMMPIIGRYHFKRYVYYAWSLPVETLVTGYGICIDTANLAGSVLRAKMLKDVWVCLGDVRATKDDTLLGRHAWVEVPYHNGQCLLETTVHPSSASSIVAAPLVYDRVSTWAQSKGLYYFLQARYNEDEYRGEGPLGAQAIEAMGLPANRVLLFGIDATRAHKPQRLYKEWRQEQMLKEYLLKEAYSNVRNKRVS